MITTDKVIEIFCIADDFFKEYEKEIQNHQLQAGNVTKKRNRQTLFQSLPHYQNTM